MSTFWNQLPDFYHFPPFFTIQPVLSTREKQLGQWRELILKYREYILLLRLFCITTWCCSHFNVIEN